MKGWLVFFATLAMVFASAIVFAWLEDPETVALLTGKRLSD